MILIGGKQTIITIFLYSNKINKFAIEVLHRLSICSSYSHLNEVLKRLAKNTGGAIKGGHCRKGDEGSLAPDDSPSWRFVVKPKVMLDNFGKMIGVRDGSSIRHAYQDNSTGGYASAVRSLPSNIKIIPRQWYTPGARRQLSPRQLKPSDAAFTYMNDFVLFYMDKLLVDHVGPGLGAGGCIQKAEGGMSGIVADHNLSFGIDGY